MSWLGVDVSTFAVHLVELDEETDGAQATKVSFGDGDLLERVRRVHYQMPHRDRWDGATAVGIERPAGGKGAWQVSMAVGAVLQCLPYGVLVEFYWPASWRKRVLGDGRGHASKDEVMAWVRERWPSCPDQDSADAYCVARALREDVCRA